MKLPPRVKVLAVLCNPIDCSLSGSPAHGILQARTLEWVIIPFSRGSSLTQGLNLRLSHCRQISLSEPAGSANTALLSLSGLCLHPPAVK